MNAGAAAATERNEVAVMDRFANSRRALEAAVPGHLGGRYRCLCDATRVVGWRHPSGRSPLQCLPQGFSDESTQGRIERHELWQGCLGWQSPAVHPSVFGLGKADPILGDPTPSRAGREISETARPGKPV